MLLCGVIAWGQNIAKIEVRQNHHSPEALSAWVQNQFQVASKAGFEGVEFVFVGDIQLTSLHFIGTDQLHSFAMRGEIGAAVQFLENSIGPNTFLNISSWKTLSILDFNVALEDSEATFLQLHGIEQVRLNNVTVQSVSSNNAITAFDVQNVSEFSLANSNLEGITSIGSVKLVNGSLSIFSNKFTNFQHGLVIGHLTDASISKNLFNSKRGEFGAQIFEAHKIFVSQNNIAITGQALDVAGIEVLGALSVVNNMFSSTNMPAISLNGIAELVYYHNSSRGTYGLVASNIQDASIINNIFFGSRTLAMRFQQVPSVFAADYNLYFSQGPNLVRIADNVYTSLAQWQLDVPHQNFHSLQGNPLFYSPSDLHVMGLLPKNNGLSTLGIQHDFDGDPRPMPANQPVDIGADEYLLPFLDVILDSIFLQQVNCSDSTVKIGVVFTNLGSVPVSQTITANLHLTGAVTNSYQSVFSRTILPGESDSLFLATLFLPGGGELIGSANLVVQGDQRPFNNSITQVELEVRPLAPLGPAFFPVCSTAAEAHLWVAPNQWSPHIWFASTSATKPLAIGDTFIVPTNASTNTYFVNVMGEKGQLSSTLNGVLPAQKAHFAIAAKKNLLIEGFNIVPSAPGLLDVVIAVKNQSGLFWDTVFADLVTANLDQLVPLQLGTILFIPAGDQVEFTIVIKSSSSSNLAVVSGHGLRYENAHIVFESGQFTSPNVQVNQAGFFCGNVSYLAEGCLTARKPIQFVIQTQTAQAAFTSTADSVGHVTFDATGAFGHVFVWDFGDGAKGSGNPITHLFASKGDYTVRLIVFDTICGTTDTIYQTIVAPNFLGGAFTESPPQWAPFPNPTNGKISFGASKGSAYQLFTAGGILVSSGFANSNDPVQVDLASLPRGLYLLRVIDERGATSNYKVVLAHQ